MKKILKSSPASVSFEDFIALCKANNLVEVEKVLKASKLEFQLDAKDADGYTALYYASQHMFKELFIALASDKRCPLDLVLFDNGPRFLDWAIEYLSSAEMAILIQNRPEILKASLHNNNRNYNLLHGAIEYTREEDLIEKILESNECDVNADAYEVGRPVEYALKTNPSIAAILIKHSRIELQSTEEKKGFTVLNTISGVLSSTETKQPVKEACLLILYSLISEKKARIDFNRVLKDGGTILHLAIALGRLDIVNELLKNADIDPNKPGTRFGRPLSAALKTDPDIAECLIKDPRTEMQDSKENGFSVLREIAAIIDEPTTPEETRRKYFTMLFSVMEKRGIDFNRPIDQHGTTFLHWLIKHGDEGLFTELLKKQNLDLNRTGEDVGTPLEYALKSRTSDYMVKRLIEDPRTKLQSKKENEFCVLKTIASLIEDNGTPKEAREHYFATLLSIADNAKIDVNRKVQGMPFLHWVIKHQRKDLLDALLKRKDLKLADDITPIELAIKTSPEMAELLIKDSRTMLQSKQQGGFCPIKVATSIIDDAKAMQRKEPYFSVLLLLFKAGKDKRIDVNRPIDDKGTTPIHWVIKHQHMGLLEALLEIEGLKLDQWVEGTLPLSYALKTNPKMAERLAKDLCVVLQDREEEGFCILKEVANLLDNTSLSPDDKQAYTSILLHTIQGGRTDVDLNKPIDAQGTTLLHWAVKGGHSKITEALLKQERVQVNAPDQASKTPLFYANLFQSAMLLLTYCKRGILLTKNDGDAKGNATKAGWFANFEKNREQCKSLLTAYVAANQEKEFAKAAAKSVPGSRPTCCTVTAVVGVATAVVAAAAVAAMSM